MGSHFHMSSFGRSSSLMFFFFNDTATTEIYTLSLHDALPISSRSSPSVLAARKSIPGPGCSFAQPRSEEHTSELQSHLNLVCPLLLEKKKYSRTFIAAARSR